MTHISNRLVLLLCGYGGDNERTTPGNTPSTCRKYNSDGTMTHLGLDLCCIIDESCQKYHFCRDYKHIFVASKHDFCRDKIMFVATKIILVAAPANDSVAIV